MNDYQTKLKSPNWQKKRLQVLSRDKWKCKLCKDEETTLHVHHLEYQPKKEPWEYPMSNFATLCEHCHREVELLKEENHFDEILIDKIKWKSGDITMFVYANSLDAPIIKIYDSYGKRSASYQFSEHSQKLILQFFKGCKKLDNYIESKDIQEYLFEKSLDEVEDKF